MIAMHHAIFGRVNFKEPLKITIDTTLGSGTNFTIPVRGSGYSYIVNWGDGVQTTGHISSASHTYSSDGVYQIEILGIFPRFYFNNIGDKLKLTSVDDWGDVGLTGSQQGAFYGCSNLTNVAENALWTSNMTNCNNMFRGCSLFTSDLSSWDVSNVTNMATMFYECFNFTSDLSDWDISSVTSMDSLFLSCKKFTSDLSNWDVSNVTNMYAMFYECEKFTSDLSGWDVSNVTNMSYMFYYCKLFNSAIGAWITINLNDISNMMRGCESFSQDLGSWDVTKITDASFFMLGINELVFTTSNLDSIYNGWGSQAVKYGISIDFGNVKYSSSSSASRANLTSPPNNWIITDGGLEF